MKLALINIVVILTIACCANSLNILGIFPYQGKSHFIVFRVLLQELARRGHNVTVITHFSEKPAANYHEILIDANVKKTEDSLPLEKRSYSSVIDVSIYLTTTGHENCAMLLSNERVQDLVKQKPKYDVILVEHFNSDCALGVAYKLEAPVVALTSHVLMPWHYKRFGIPYNPSYVSFHFLEGGTKPSLCQRIERVIFDTYFRLLYYFVTQRRDQMLLQKYFNGIPPLEELAKNIKFLLISHHFTLTGSALLPANVIEVGGYHVSKANQLTGDIKEFVDEAKSGIIYISFGSTVKISTMSVDKLEAILGAIAELPQRFIWRWDNTNIDKPPFNKLRKDLQALLVDRKKLFISTWLPQVDILGDPNTVAFFSHAGMGGATEAIHFGVPVIAMPITGDQPANAASIEESGLGVQISVADLSKDNLLAAFKTVLDSKFRENAKKLSKAWNDRPLSPMDTAVFWIEYAARNSNFTFRAPSADVPIYQYLCLDVIGVFTLIFAILLTVIKVFKVLLFPPKKQMKIKKKRN